MKSIYKDDDLTLNSDGLSLKREFSDEFRKMYLKYTRMGYSKYEITDLMFKIISSDSCFINLGIYDEE